MNTYKSWMSLFLEENLEFVLHLTCGPSLAQPNHGLIFTTWALCSSCGHLSYCFLSFSAKPSAGAGRATGGPGASYEKIILHNNRHGGIIRVCMRIFTTALRNTTIRQILNENNPPYFHSVKIIHLTFTAYHLMKSTHFSELSISRFSTYVRKARWKPRNGQLAKTVLFIKESGQITSDTLWK